MTWKVLQIHTEERLKDMSLTMAIRNVLEEGHPCHSLRRSVMALLCRTGLLSVGEVIRE
jgi:hypothetical protein